MKTIFIIDGTSGIWKSDLINFVSKSPIKSRIIKKSSTRTKTSNDTTIDLKFMDEELFDSFNFDYVYTYDNKKYGFFKKEVEDAINNSENVFIVIRNLDLIKKFSSDFNQHNIVVVFIYTDFDVVSKRLPNANSLQNKKSIEDAFQDYLSHPKIYDDLIINGGTANDFNRLLDVTVSRFTEITNNIEGNKTSDNKTRFFCLNQAKKLANIIVIVLIVLALGSWYVFYQIIEKYDWDKIEPLLSLTTIPTLYIAFSFSWFLITKRTFTLNPQVFYKSIVDYYYEKFLRLCIEQ